MLCDGEWYAAFYSVVDSDLFFSVFSVEHAKSSTGRKLGVILQYLTSRGVGGDCGGRRKFRWGILTKLNTNNTLINLPSAQMYCVSLYIYKKKTFSGAGGTKRKKTFLHMEAWNIILVWEIYVHMASIFNNIWQNVVWGLKFTFFQSFISNTDLVYTGQLGWVSLEIFPFLSLQIIATLSSSKLLLKLCLIYKRVCCYLFYIKEYWWKGSSCNCWHESVFGSFFFF